MANSFKPDVILALGGGSPMDAAKEDHVGHVRAPAIYRVRRSGHALHGHPQAYLQHFPKMGVKAELVCITTTSGTGC
ncbi:iron-containing alcohol dehydrogenase [Escherichia coli]